MLQKQTFCMNAFLAVACFTMKAELAILIFGEVKNEQCAINC